MIAELIVSLSCIYNYVLSLSFCGSRMRDVCHRVHFRGIVHGEMTENVNEERLYSRTNTFNLEQTNVQTSHSCSQEPRQMNQVYMVKADGSRSGAR